MIFTTMSYFCFIYKIIYIYVDTSLFIASVKYTNFFLINIYSFIIIITSITITVKTI